MLVIALMSASMTVWLVLWAFANEGPLGAAFWLPLVISALVAAVSFTLARGCYVEVRPRTIRDVVFWIPVSSLDRGSIETVRIRPGIWRVFEVTMDDGRSRVLLGASPHQFPSRLLESARSEDVSDMDLILGD